VRDIIAPSERLLLSACLAGGEAAIRAFEAWRPHGTPGTLDGRNLRMMPLLYRNLTRLGFDDPYMEWMRGLAKHVWLSGSLHRRTIGQALDRLEAAGIPMLRFKGAAFLARWPEAADIRPMGDFDILVPSQYVRDAVACLRDDGWASPAPHLIADGDLVRWHAALLLKGHDTSIDLHWRPAAAIGDPAYTAAVQARGEVLSLDGRQVRVAGLTDHLFILLAHAFYNLPARRFDWVAEAVLTLRRAGTQVDWSLMDTLARRYRMRAWIDRAFTEIAAIGQVPIPVRGRRTAFGQRLEIAARIRAASGPAAALVPALGDVRRSGRVSLADPSLLAEFGRILAVPGRLKHRALLAVLRRSSFAASQLGAIGPDGFVPGRDVAGGSFLAGWSVPETGGRWTERSVAWLLLRLPEGVSCRLPLRLRTYSIPADMTPSAPDLGVDVWTGGQVQRCCYPGGELLPLDRFLDGRAMAWRGVRVLPLFMSFITPIEPRARGNTTLDPRALGLFLRRIDLASTATIPELGDGVDLSSSGPAVDLAANEHADAMCWSGWSVAEPAGRWTSGAEARLLVNPGPAGMRALRLTVAHLYPPDQAADVLVGEKVVAQVAGPGPVDVPVTAGADGLIDIRLRPTAPVSPRALGQSDDPRVLGVMVRSVTRAGGPSAP
jgi:hypothetical protein